MTPRKNDARPEYFTYSDLAHILTNTKNIKRFQTPIILKIFQKNYK
ncbi:hypothetical protein E2C01_058062 [Portunus trituberculatus]|uniref:Uncharacterized protein n=1 Tax=Portunus trituberculatus TaxID=210409 RepID=A0A5B7H519_PORTR|nr:hypothetical protein [Portunus trituberculatus]